MASQGFLQSRGELQPIHGTLNFSLDTMLEGDHDYRRADASKVVSGKIAEYIVTHPGCSQYSQVGGGVSACGIAALNCARIVLGLHAAGLGCEQLVQELMRRRLLEDILLPCLTWSSPAHLSVDEIHKAPIFQQSLKSVHTDYGQPTFEFFKKLISTSVEYSERHSTSSCVIITRPPEIIACFCIANAPAELYVVFDSHPRPEKHPDGAAFIFKNSLNSTAKYITDLLRYDERLLSDSTIQWQAQLLAHASGEIFVACDTPRSSAHWADTALDASLQVLHLQAQLRDLESKNQNIESDNKRLNDEVTDLEDKLLELDDELDRLKKRHAQCSRRVAGNGHEPDRHPECTRILKFRSFDARYPHPNIDPLAVQMQKDFDEENRQLERQFRQLQHTQPKVFDCGICMDSLPEDIVARVMPCGHLYCRPCLKSWVVSTIERHRYPIMCPTCAPDKARSDPSEIDDFMIQGLGLTDKQYDIYSEMQLARVSTIIHCRKCLATVFVDKVEYQEASTIVCPLRGCGYAWCKACSQAIEIGGPQHSCDGSSELSHLMQQHGWKHCPGCQTPAEKIDGCNHMTCMAPACNGHFCYLCGELIVQSVLRREIQSAVSRHYRRCTLF
ncbi:hypothetical protein C8Q80DRAFT_1268812 [Daedaleopsis nitida]|nr:hypothetical protein C8Q80DRAFT_1268812 [Daedaleopsis nitida]